MRLFCLRSACESGGSLQTVQGSAARTIGLGEGADGGGWEGGHLYLLHASRLKVLGPLKQRRLQLLRVVGCGGQTYKRLRARGRQRRAPD